MLWKIVKNTFGVEKNLDKVYWIFKYKKNYVPVIYVLIFQRRTSFITK